VPVLETQNYLTKSMRTSTRNLLPGGGTSKRWPIRPHSSTKIVQCNMCLYFSQRSGRRRLIDMNAAVGEGGRMLTRVATKSAFWGLIAVVLSASGAVAETVNYSCDAGSCAYEHQLGKLVTKEFKGQCYASGDKGPSTPYSQSCIAKNENVTCTVTACDLTDGNSCSCSCTIGAPPAGTRPR
jgi:hypothetical protein